MHDDWIAAHGLFAFEIASGLLVYQVVCGMMSKETAAAVIDGALDHLLDAYPAHEQHLRKIAAKVQAQVAMLTIEIHRQSREEGD